MRNVSCLLIFVVLTFRLSRGSGDCMAPVQTPDTVFGQENIKATQPLRSVLVDDSEECNTKCCREDECTVTVFDPQPPEPDTANCLLFNCSDPSSCNIPQHQGTLTFLDVQLQQFHNIQSNEEPNPNPNSPITESTANPDTDNGNEDENGVGQEAPNQDPNKGKNPSVSSTTKNSSEIPEPPLTDSIIQPPPSPSPLSENSTPSSASLPSEQLSSTPVLNTTSSTPPIIAPPSLNDTSELPVSPETEELKLEPSVTTSSVSSILSPSSSSLLPSSLEVTSQQVATPVLSSVMLLSSMNVIMTSSIAPTISEVVIPSATATQAENQAASEDNKDEVQPANEDNKDDLVSLITSTVVFGDSSILDKDNASTDYIDQSEPFPIISGPMGALLITTLIIGCVLLLGVVFVMAKRLFDSYKKRNYSRLEDYLINGMYN